MTSPAKKFRKKYKVTDTPDEKNEISKTKKVAVGLGLATSLAVSTLNLSGCSKENTKQEHTIEITNQEPTKENGENYTDKEKEKIKKVIEQKDEFLDKVLETYRRCHPNREISKSDIAVIEETTLFLWINNGRHYVDQDTNAYKNDSKIKRDKEARDRVVVDTKNKKLLFTISKDNEEVHESFLEGYYSEKEKRGYINDKEYGTVINKQYTKEDCFKGATALLKYQTNGKYRNWEKYLKTQINKIYQTIEEPEL